MERLERQIQQLKADRKAFCRGQLGATLGVKPRTPCCEIRHPATRQILLEAAMRVLGCRPANAQLCHRCDNPPCVRVDHLFWGTPRDNARDSYLKGRARPFGQFSRKHTKKQYKVTLAKLQHKLQRLQSKWQRLLCNR